MSIHKIILYFCHRFGEKSGLNEEFAYSKNVLKVWPQKDVPMEYADVHIRGCLICLLVRVSQTPKDVDNDDVHVFMSLSGMGV